VKEALVATNTFLPTSVAALQPPAGAIPPAVFTRWIKVVSVILWPSAGPYWAMLQSSSTNVRRRLGTRPGASARMRRPSRKRGGITDALRHAELLARAVLTGTDSALASYQAIRDDLSVPLFTITDEIASFDRDFPRLQALHKALSDEMAREVSQLSLTHLLSNRAHVHTS
jgi:hypothetical protein